jgi:hypothetical protein
VCLRYLPVRHCKLLLTGLLLVALVFRALVPAGFMPTFRADGTSAVTMQICPMHMPAMGHAPADDGQHPAPKSGGQVHEGGICVFAASAISAPPPSLAPPTLQAHADPEPISAAVETVTLPSIVRSQSPRAPPFLA